MPLDLTPFYGIDTSRLTPDALDYVRHTFAAAVIDFAATCRTNHELLDGLALGMPPESSLPLPTKLGEGSTRRTWSLPFNLALKLERRDDLSPEEMEWRGSTHLLCVRRRVSTINEVATSLHLPNMLTQIYGLLFAFGTRPPNLACLIVERLRSLDADRPGDTIGIPNTQLFQCSATGQLLVSDERFSAYQPKRGDRSLAEIFPRNPESGTWLGNIGRDAMGRFYLLDSGNHEYRGLCMDEKTFMPMLNQGNHWKDYPEGAPEHLTQTIQLSKEVFSFYQRKRSLSEAPQAA